VTKNGMRREIVLAGQDLVDLIAIWRLVDPKEYAVSVLESQRPLERLIARGCRTSAVLIACLTGDENVAELRTFCEAFSETAIVFLSPVTPLRHSLARVIEDAGATVMSITEKPLTIVASAVALSYQRNA